jgi:hypothetical protein
MIRAQGGAARREMRPWAGACGIAHARTLEMAATGRCNNYADIRKLRS